MNSRFFIDRPVLTIVIMIFTVMMGLIALPNLEIARYPSIAPPSVRVSLSYPGASAATLERTVAQVVEQRMTGLDNLLYFSSRANSEGQVTMSFSFDPKVDPDVAQMQVQNRLDSIMSQLPEVVQRRGATIRKVSDDTLQQIAFFASDGSLSQEDVADFLASVIQDPLSRVNGVGEVNLRGSQYAIRIWLDQGKLRSFSLNPDDVVSAVERQNYQVSAGQLGALPQVEGQPININVKSRELLETITDFENLVLYVGTGGDVVYLKDVAVVEMGRDNYTYFGNYNSRPMAALSIDLSEGANAVDTARAVDDLLIRLSPLFPDKLEYAYAYDTVPFVKASLYEVSKTLAEALVLVSLVLFLFLRSWKATLIVAVTIPVVLSGTLCVLWAFGYSINTLTMFAMVLAIGLLVDDAIVVVENITRIVQEKQIPVVEAAASSLKEIAPALVGVGLVISAVFTPMGFFPGASGNIYRQFAVTIVTAMLLSVAVAVIITPGICARFLVVKTVEDQKPNVILDFVDRNFTRLKYAYSFAYQKSMEKLGCTLILFVLLCLADVGLFLAIPSSFLPVEDQSVLTGRIIMPPGTTQDRTRDLALEIEDYFLTEEKEYVEGVMLTLGAGGPSASGQAAATIIVKLKHWDERSSFEASAQALLDRAKRRFESGSDARIIFFLPPSVFGLGSSSGFNVYVQNVNGIAHEQFLDDVREIVSRANSSVSLYNVRYEAQDDAPELLININDLKAGQHGLDPDDINTNLSIAWGGEYVNDFIDRGRIKSVYVQSAPQYRSLPQDINDLYLRNSYGEMVSLGLVADTSWDYGPKQLERFNGVSAIAITGDPASGVSTGEAMVEIASIINAHPGNYSYAWTGASYQEVESGNLVKYLFLISAIAVFLCLAALYESWIVPVSVILIIPVGVLGSLLFVLLRDFNFDVYLQVGLLTTGGLAAKNAILIVEYAAQFGKRGLSLTESASRAAMIRFRPIVMTSAAFLLGVLPLCFATGAGAASQQSIGTGVVGGTLLATSLGIILVPAFYVMVCRLIGSQKDSQ